MHGNMVIDSYLSFPVVAGVRQDSARGRKSEGLGAGGHVGVRLLKKKSGGWLSSVVDGMSGGTGGGRRDRFPT